MGILLGPDGHRNFLCSLIHDYIGFWCLLLYPAGIVSFVLLTYPDVLEHTYFSDNSLLPGMVERSTNIQREAEGLLETLKSEAKSHSSIPYAWLAGQFRQGGLDVYRHNFSLAYPLGSRHVHTGENLYAILRASRAARTEAIVISAPFRSQISPHATNLPSVAAMIALAKHFRRQNYWSKDIIFLVTEHEHVGLQAWLDAYHIVETSPGVILPGELEARSGTIMAAINLELHSRFIDQVNMKILGLNGQLPNLDLVNTCRNLLQRESVPYVLEGRYDSFDGNNHGIWKGHAMNLFTQMSKQATGSPTGAHGLYHRFAIQALTIQGQPKIRGYKHVTLNHLGRVIEGLVRSVNNLLQRFHRSFFYYFLPATDRYISIAYYMGAFSVLLSGVLLRAISLLLELYDQHPTAYLTLLWKSLPLPIAVQCLGILLFALPAHGELLVKWIFPLSTQDALYTFFIFFISSLLIAPIGTKRAIEPQAQRLIMLLHYLLVLSTISMLNISLAIFAAAVSVPVVLTAGENCILPFRIIQRVLQLAVNPLVVTYFVLGLHAIALDKWRLDEPVVYAKQAFDAHRKLLLFSVEDWYIYGATNFPIVCLGFVPVWLHMWSL